MSFSEFGLRAELLRAIKTMGFESPTPIQEKAIPPALAGSDILGSAQTGSGKTVAFALPLLHKLMGAAPGSRAEPEGAMVDKEMRSTKAPGSRAERGRTRAVILVPTRELAAQVEETLKACAQFSGIRCTLVIGGASWNKQSAALAAGADVVVATPGRLLDHLRNNRSFGLASCEIAVLDEADRMLDMGFLPDIRAILERIPSRRQTLMFSATVPPEIERLVGQFMRDPIRVQIDSPRAPAAGITQKIYPVSTAQKYDLLLALLKSFDMNSALVFTGTKRKADIVGGFLRSRGVEAAVLHSDLSQAQRDRTMEGFRSRKHTVLVATDIAARGLDVRHVSHVVNYDVPQYPEDYLHRIGRTARAFTVGEAVTLMTPDEKKFVSSIENFIGSEIPRCALEGFPYDVPPKLDVYKPAAHSHFRMRRRIRSGRRSLF